MRGGVIALQRQCRLIAGGTRLLPWLCTVWNTHERCSMLWLHWTDYPYVLLDQEQRLAVAESSTPPSDNKTWRLQACFTPAICRTTRRVPQKHHPLLIHRSRPGVVFQEARRNVLCWRLHRGLAGPSHASGDTLHCDSKGVAKDLNVRLILVVAHAQQQIGLQHIDRVHQRHSGCDREACVLHSCHTSHPRSEFLHFVCSVRLFYPHCHSFDSSHPAPSSGCP